MTADRADSDNTGRWESEGGAEPHGPATHVPADEDEIPGIKGAPPGEPEPQEPGESG